MNDVKVVPASIAIILTSLLVAAASAQSFVALDPIASPAAPEAIGLPHLAPSPDAILFARKIERPPSRAPPGSA